ncbi:MAG TPA: alpha/beta hydrolase [Eoetvoesiella sp.]
MTQTQVNQNKETIDVRERSVSANGIKIHVYCGGSGAPVLFFHGAAGVKGWTPYFDALSERYEVFAPSHPGFGHSDDAPELGNPRQVAEFYQAWIKELGIDKCHLVGSSLGAWVASEFASLDDSALQSLTLIAPPGLAPKSESGPAPGQSAAEYAIRKLFLDQGIADRWLAAEPTNDQKLIIARNRVATARIAGEDFYNPQLKEAVRSIVVPTLVVWGDSDAVVPVEQAELWGQAIQNSQIEIIEECGHLPHMERTAVTMERIFDFHDSISR